MGKEDKIGTEVFRWARAKVLFLTAALTRVMRATVPIPALASASVVHSAGVGGSVVDVVRPGSQLSFTEITEYVLFSLPILYNTRVPLR